MSDSRAETSSSEAWVIGLTALAVLVAGGFWVNSWIHGTYRDKTPPCVQQARTLALAMFCYANDNGGKYPTGKSSTEVFQKLLDDKYISDPEIFFDRYARIPGKTKATSMKLAPANVCWDVTGDVDSTADPDEIPLVYWTGFRMQYTPGGSAIPLSSTTGSQEGLAIAFKNNGAKFMLSDPRAAGIVREVVQPGTVFPTGRKYVQLTPDGPLGP